MHSRTKNPPKLDQRSFHQQQQQQQHSHSHSSQQSSPQKSLQQYPQNQSLPTQKLTMLQFIDSLYTKFKLLNKLSEQQSSNFQTEVIQMLIDENQCLDVQLYQQTVQKIGLGTFVLQVLGSVVQKRNKFKNQYQMGRNLQEITREIDRQRLEVGKKKKQLQKRQINMVKKQQAVMQLIKQKAQQIEERTRNSLLVIEEQIKKRVKTLLATLKQREKQRSDKVLGMKQGLQKIRLFQEQQRTLDQKIRMLEKKEKQRKTKETQEKQQLASTQQSAKKLQEMNGKITTLQQVIKSKQEQLIKLGKKLKTSEMAYRHYKEETERKLLKCNEANNQVGEFVIEKEKLLREKEKLIEELKEERLRSEKRDKQLERVKKDVERGEVIAKRNQAIANGLRKTIDQLKKENNALLLKLKQLSQQRDNCLIPQFQELDISKIYTPERTQHQNFIHTNCQQREEQDYSIIHQVSQSILVMDSCQRKEEFKGQRNEMSQGCGVKGLRESEENESQEEDSRDVQREREYFEKRKIVSKNNMPQSTQSKQSKQQQKNSLKQRMINLKQQQQEEQNQTQTEQPQPHSLNNSNIQLFDNYFKTKPSPIPATKFTTQSQSNSTKQSPSQQYEDKPLRHQPPPTAIKQPNIHQKILSQLNTLTSPSLSQQQLCQQLTQLNQQKISLWVTKISNGLKYPRQLVQPLLQLLLLILQPCTCPNHRQSLHLLFNQQVVSFLQQVLLKFEALIPSIQQKSLVILSRILLSYQNQQDKPLKFTLKQNYLKSLKVKLLLEKDQFIRSNINFLMEYE